MYRSRKKGATLAFVAACAFVLFLIGTAIFYIFQLFSGDKQIMNATDAGALAAAQQLLTVTLTPAQVQALPSEFTGLGVDSNGNRCPNGQDSNGNPALYNIIAYNNCAAYSLEIAFNAASSGSSTAIANACTVIEGLNTFAQQLSKNIQNSSFPTNAASQMMENNNNNNLPAALFGGVIERTTLVPGSLQMGYYASPTAYSDMYFPTAFTSSNTQITAWVNQVLSSTSSSNNGPRLIAAAKPFDINQITGQTGFVDSTGKDLVIALVPVATQLTHLISTNSSYYSKLPPGSSKKSNYYLPQNAVQLEGQVIGNSRGSRTKNQEVLGLIVSSAAVASNGGQYVASIPAAGSTGTGSSGSSSGGSSSTGSPNSSSTSGSTGGTGSSPSSGTPTSGSGSSSSGSGTTGGVQTQGAAYIAIINGGDYTAAMNNAHMGAAAAKNMGYFNLDLTPNTNIAFDHSQTNIFDVLSTESTAANCGTNMIIVGVSSNIGVYAPSSGGIWNGNPNGQTLTNAETYIESNNYPSTNYNNVVDNPGLASPTTSIPFFLSLNNAAPNGDLSQLLNQVGYFDIWITYNRSTGSDGLGHDPSLDPLKNNGGSPALFNSDPNAPVPGSLIRATSRPGQIMTIGDALQLQDIVIVECQSWPGLWKQKQPDWVYSLFSVVASNYGYAYLPVPLNESKNHGFTALEWVKAQITCINGGVGLSQNPPILPNLLPSILLGNYPAAAINTSPYSGLKYFVPFDTSGNPAHYIWPEPAGCPEFETCGTPLQLLQNINIIRNGGTFNPSDTDYAAGMNSMLNIAQQMNPAVTMSDLTNVLNSSIIDMGQTLFIVYNSGNPTNHGLQLTGGLPGGMTYTPGDGTTSTGFGYANYMVAQSELHPTQDGQTAINPNYSGCILANTIADSTSSVINKGQAVCPAPTGDSKSQGPLYTDLTPVAAADYAIFTPCSGANNNHGELKFKEYIYGCLYETNSLESSVRAQNPYEWWNWFVLPTSGH